MYWSPMLSAAASSSLFAVSSSLGSIKVLIVDDDPFVRDVLSDMLGRCSYVVVVAEGGAQALEILDSDPELPDIILIDVLMPGIDGTQLLKLLKSRPRLRGIPVVMMSVIQGRDLVAACLQDGADYFLLKPLRMEELKLLWQFVVMKRKNSRLGQIEDEYQWRLDAALKENKEKSDTIRRLQVRGSKAVSKLTRSTAHFKRLALAESALDLPDASETDQDVSMGTRACVLCGADPEDLKLHSKECLRRHHFSGLWFKTMARSERVTLFLCSLLKLSSSKELTAPSEASLSVEDYGESTKSRYDLGRLVDSPEEKIKVQSELYTRLGLISKQFVSCPLLISFG